jgi:myosin heavy subunit
VSFVSHTYATYSVSTSSADFCCRKTEASKHALLALCQISTSQPATAAVASSLANRLSNAWLLLEAFGHAKTLRNANSSRFGCSTRVQFSSVGGAEQAAIESALLDAGRCVRVPRSERSFHVLYQLCVAALPSDLRASLQVVAAAGADAFSCLSASGTIYAEGVDDREAFNVTSAALEAVGLRGQAQHGLWRVLSAVLHLSNVRFIEADGGVATGIDASSLTSLKVAANLLGLSDAVLQQHLLQRSTPGTQPAQARLSATQATAARNALSSSLYSRAFGAVLVLINAYLRPVGASDFVSEDLSSRPGRLSTDTAAVVQTALRLTQDVTSSDRRGAAPSLRSPVVTVLDPHGAENLAVNGFHQLCANYCDVSQTLCNRVPCPQPMHILCCIVTHVAHAGAAAGLYCRRAAALPCC